MILERLWEDLEPLAETLPQLKKDYARGITPELPYFIVGHDHIKEKIGEYLMELDGDYFNRSLIYSDYGNGKTNLLKYLELYVREENLENVQYIYQRANVDKPDVFLSLLKLIEDNLVDKLVAFMGNLSVDFIKKQKDENANISDYIDKVTAGTVHSRKELVLMGTGRFYTKNYYNQHAIAQLQDFDRREVFKFFMNVLSENNFFVIFALDEIEKIYEKSKMRFRTFLTSYRELIDLSSQIKGHFLLTAIVSSAANVEDFLFENPALYSRIRKDMLEVGFLTTANEKKELTRKVASLLELELTQEEIEDIVSGLRRTFGKGAIRRSNRYMLGDIFNSLNKKLGTPVFSQLADKLEKHELEDEFEETFEDLEGEGVFSKIENSFFDPLQYYLEYKGYEVNTKKENNLFKKTNLFYPYKSKKVYSFIVNDKADITKEIQKLKELLLDDNQLVIAFTPEKLDIKYEDFESENITIVNYDPKKMFTLLVMFEELEFQNEIVDIIHHYTKGEL